jgi:hypothetical protein
VAQSVFFRYAVVNPVAVGVDGACVADGVGGLVVAEEIQQAVRTAPGVPVEVTRACGDVAVSPEASLAGGAVAGSEVVDGCFIDLEFAGTKEFGFDRLAERGEVPGGGVDPGVEGLAPDVDVDVDVVPSSSSSSSSEALGLAVVGKVDCKEFAFCGRPLKEPVTGPEAGEKGVV